MTYYMCIICQQKKNTNRVGYLCGAKNAKLNYNKLETSHLINNRGEYERWNTPRFHGLGEDRFDN
jgi:hypothetical protein